MHDFFGQTDQSQTCMHMTDREVKVGFSRVEHPHTRLMASLVLTSGFFSRCVTWLILQPIDWLALAFGVSMWDDCIF